MDNLKSKSYEIVGLMILTSKSVERMQRFQNMMVSMVERCTDIDLDDVDHAITDFLAEMGEFTGLDRVYIFEYRIDEGFCRNTHEWCSTGIDPQIDNLQNERLEDIKEWFQNHISGNAIVIPDVSAHEDDVIRDILTAQEIKSIATVPCLLKGELIGFVGFDSVRSKYTFDDLEMGLLKVFSGLISNLASRVYKDKESKDARAMIKIILNTVPVQVWELRDEETYGIVNESHAEFLGFDKDTLTGKSLHEIFDRTTADICILGNKSVFGTGETLKTEEWCSDSKGVPRLLSIRKTPRFGDDSQVVSVVCCADDITEERAKEERLMEKDKLLTHAQMFSRTGAWDYNLRTGHLYWSPECEHLFGLEKGGFGGRFQDFIEMVHPEDQEYVRNINFPIVDNGIPKTLEYEHRMTSNDGKVMWVKESAGIMYGPDGEPEKIAGFVMDITELKNNEEEFRQLSSKLDFMISNIPAVVYTYRIHHDGKIEICYINEKLSDELGYDAGFFIGDVENWTENVHPEDLGSLADKLRGREGTDVYRFKDVDGKYHWLNDTQSVLERNEGYTTMIGAWWDLTERKEMEDELAGANDKLNLLSRTIRHDIQNQLTVLKGVLTLSEYDDEFLSMKGMGMIQQATDVIDSCVSFAKEYQSIGIKEPEWQTLASMIPQPQEPGPLLIFDLAGVMIFADDMLFKVFDNLMDNCLRHAKELTTIEIQFVTEEDGGARILWSDDGCGVSEKDKERIFNMGYGNNTGMGLTICKEILSITGMEIREIGVPGEGALFEISVPADAWRLKG